MLSSITFDFSPFNLNYNPRTVRVAVVPRAGELVHFAEFPNNVFRVHRIEHHVGREMTTRVRAYLKAA